MQVSALCYVPRVLLRIGLFLSLLQHCHNASLPPDHRTPALPKLNIPGITLAWITTRLHCMCAWSKLFVPYSYTVL